MGLRKFVQLLLHGERRLLPRTADAADALHRKKTVEQRLRKLEIDLEIHVGKPPARHGS